MKLRTRLQAKLMRVAARVERAAGRVQGKGYLSPAFSDEVAAVFSFLGAEKPKLAIDIGGNVGEYAAELRKAAPQLEMHIFEPSAVNIEKLNAKFSGDRLVNVVPIAVSDTSSVALLHSDRPGSPLGSLAKRRLDHFGTKYELTEEVKTTRFDEYWVEHLNRRVLDVVKIDIEGHELSALRGFGEAIGATRVLQFEFGGTNIDTRTFWQDFWYFFKTHGFELHRITPFGVHPLRSYRESDECFAFVANFIAVNRRFAG